MLDVVILEDDSESLDAMTSWVESLGFTCRGASTVQELRRELDARLPDVAVLDIQLPDGSGLDVLDTLSPTEVDVVMVSGQTTVDDAIAALRLGAADLLRKPVDLDRLRTTLEKAVRSARMRREIEHLRNELREVGRFGDIVGISSPMQKLYDALSRIAPTDETVLITGQTGTGKEVTATTLHKLSRRKEGRFIAVNCGAVSASLIESEMFGHERGSFTGADRRRAGVFESANGGSLFLDEITEMPAELQVRLLRVLETRKIVRVGGTQEIDVDVRIIAATNRDPARAVEEGKLREDLFYRLNVLSVALPPLADREGDVELLAKTFLDRLNREYGARKRFTPAAIERLNRHDWPGNVRELSNLVRRAYVMAKGDIGVNELPLPLAEPTPVAPARGQGDDLGIVAGMKIAEAERRLIRATLDLCEGNKKQAAERLGISLKTLYSRLQVYAASDEAGAR